MKHTAKAEMRTWIKALRIHHWVKNLLVFAPAFFGGKIGEISYILASALAFAAFSLASSGIYLINDILDIKEDRLHPRKKNRPIASGKITAGTALPIALLLLFLSLSLSVSLGYLFLIFLVAYLGLNLLYSTCLKRLPLFDIFTISFGFVLRVYGGGAATGIKISSWLFVTVFLLTLCFAVGKRLSENLSLGENAHLHRKSLSEYPQNFLTGAFWSTAVASLVTYSLYTVEKGHSLIFTVPIAAFGLMRYILLVESQREGDPTEALLSDPQIIVTSIVWIASIYFLTYGGQR